MYCNKSIHFYLDKEFSIECPFCYKRIQHPNPQKYKCCDNMEITNNSSCFICKQCASVHGHQTYREYIYFYENLYRIKRKSVYNRKYQLQNKIRTLCYQNNVQISYSNQQKILAIFKQIDEILVLSIVNNKTRKRMIKIDFILNKLFHLLHINIKISQKESKDTLLHNEKYWDKINSWIGNEIQAIFDR